MIDFDRWHREARTYVHRGHAVFYRTEGAGPSLLALHGFPSASWDWHAVWTSLTERFRVIAPDFLGFGWSDKPRSHDYSILDQASLCEGLLRELEVTRVHLLAHDYGDTVAQELLARHDQLRGERGVRIASVFLLNGGIFPEMHRPRPVQRLLASPLGPLVGRLMGQRAGFGRRMKAIFGPGTPPSEVFLDELWTLLEHAHGRRVMHRLIGYMAERRRHRDRWVGALRDTRVPLRFVDGLADPVSGAHMVSRYRELVPNADVVELPGIGHYPQIEAPDAVLRAFFAFHERVEP